MGFVSRDLVLRHLSIDGHARPVEFLGGLADQRAEVAVIDVGMSDEFIASGGVGLKGDD
jgi:hypothetical protein